MQFNWQLATQIAQVAMTVITGVGIIGSIVIALRSLKEMKADRSLRVRPQLLFNIGGQRVECELRELAGIPGVNPEYAKKLLRDKPAGALSCDPRALWGGLTNFGSGPALNTRVTFITQRIIKANEEFQIDEIKLKASPYSLGLNTIPATPSHIRAGDSGSFFRLPTPIVIDFNGQLTEMAGLVAIQYQDIYGSNFETKQPFRAFVERGPDETFVILTFDEHVPEVAP